MLGERTRGTETNTKEKEIAAVPPSEGNEARREGRQGVLVVRFAIPVTYSRHQLPLFSILTQLSQHP